MKKKIEEFRTQTLQLLQEIYNIEIQGELYKFIANNEDTKVDIVKSLEDINKSVVSKFKNYHSVNVHNLSVEAYKLHMIVEDDRNIYTFDSNLIDSYNSTVKLIENITDVNHYITLYFANVYNYTNLLADITDLLDLFIYEGYTVAESKTKVSNYFNGLFMYNDYEGISFNFRDSKTNNMLDILDINIINRSTGDTVITFCYYLNSL